jgi:hypothetical protein
LALAFAAVAFALAAAARAGAQDDPDALLGTGAAIAVETDWISVEPGSPLYREPDTGSNPLAVIEVETELEVLERREDWLRVRHGALTGWISTRDEEGSARPSARASTESARQIARAREVFGPAERPGFFGEFSLYTDVEDKRLLSSLEKVSRHLPEAYASRYGLQGEPSGREAILLFEREADYRAFTLESFGDHARHRPDLRGHSAPGIAVLYVGDHSLEEVAAVLVHELTHLLNRRVFAEPIPPWLEEGLANDLGFCRIDGRGRLRFATLGGRGVVIEQPEYEEGGFLRIDRRVNLTGPVASLRSVRERWMLPEGHSATLLTDLGWDEFTELENRSLNYAASAFLVRYLLDSEGNGSSGWLAEGFRSFLRSVAAGEDAGAQELVECLGQERDRRTEGSLSRSSGEDSRRVDSGKLENLDRSFADWLADQR